MQRNPGCKTIEGDLHSALVAARGIAPDNADDFAKVQHPLQRAARNIDGSRLSLLANVRAQADTGSGCNLRASRLADICIMPAAACARRAEVLTQPRQVLSSWVRAPTAGVLEPGGAHRQGRLRDWPGV